MNEQRQQSFSKIERALKVFGLESGSPIRTNIPKQKESIFIVLLITLIMLLVEYYGWQRPFLRLIAPKLNLNITTHTRLLFAQGYTTFSFWLLFIMIPSLFLMLYNPSKDKRELGLGLPKTSDLLPYFLIGVVMFISLLFVCAAPSFYLFYPLFRPHNINEWLSFELIYMAQFIAIEFFFRGPLLFRLNKLHGTVAIVFMTLPYALVHIHKPFPEALGSIVAGLALGHLSLKSKSIWPGVLLHMFIAFSADSLGLFYGGDFTRW